jgi:succinate-semialdehyde dehydrogenase/glutarate-semialdehyde dehydrogenase
MVYQTINPYTEELIKTFPSHTDAEIESIIAQAEKDIRNGLESKTPCRAQGRSQEGRVDLARADRRIRQTDHSGDG